MQFATKPIQHYPSHLICMLLHYLGKLKIQISGRLSTGSVSRNVFNSLLTPCFVQEIRLSTSLLCTPSNTNFLLKSLVFVAEYHVGC